MISLIALGNKGAKYANTRHNVGMIFAEFVKKENKIRCFSSDTYMNLSGKYVRQTCQKNRIDILDKNTYLICDHLEKTIGKWQIKSEGSHGGHNGLKSVFQYEKTDKI